MTGKKRTEKMRKFLKETNLKNTQKSIKTIKNK